jgi:hypothetical protein
MPQRPPAAIARSVTGLPAAALLAAALLAALPGCRPGLTDPFCQTRNAADLTPSARDYAAMSPAERREAQRRLDDAARRCGWEP